jgi:hypothetical protein
MFDNGVYSWGRRGGSSGVKRKMEWLSDMLRINTLYTRRNETFFGKGNPDSGGALIKKEGNWWGGEVSRGEWSDF